LLGRSETPANTNRGKSLMISKRRRRAAPFDVPVVIIRLPKTQAVFIC
jgi:hypothetical protein